MNRADYFFPSHASDSRHVISFARYALFRVNGRIYACIEIAELSGRLPSNRLNDCSHDLAKEADGKLTLMGLCTSSKATCCA